MKLQTGSLRSAGLSGCCMGWDVLRAHTQTHSLGCLAAACSKGE